MTQSIKTPVEMKSYFDSLPSDIQDVLIDERLISQISQICTGNAVAEKIKTVKEITMATLMALQPIKGFVGRIAQATDTPPAIAQKIADQINENIFRPVRQSLIKIHEIPPNEQVEIPAVEAHFEHLLESHSPSTIALAPGLVAVDKPATVQAAPVTRSASIAPTAPKTLAQEKMSRPTSLPPQVSRSSSEPDPYREPID